MPLTFSTSYEATPWATSLDKNERTWYTPELLDAFTQNSIFYRMVDYVVDLQAQRTRNVVFTQPLTPPPNIAQLAVRALWLPQLYMDSRQTTVTTLRYGDKVQLDRFSDYVTYWQANGADGLRPLMRDLLGPHMTGSLDILARNAFLSSHFKTFAGNASGINNLVATDVFDVGITRGLRLRQAYQTDPTKNPLFCVTSPAATYTVTADDDGEWVERNQYANPAIIVNGEIGMYENCRFIESPLLTLWNCGAVLNQTTIGTSIAVGDGAPDPDDTNVDGVWRVGQAGATHYITVANSAGFTVGDIVTLHTERPSAYTTMATYNGVVWDSAYNLQRRIVAKPTSTRLCFDEPVTVDWYQTNLGGAVYGYVTKARPVHAAIFIWGPRTVVCGVTQPPQTYTPAPVDDTGFIYRFSWDAYLRYAPFYTNRYLVHFYAGPVDINGVVTNL